MSTLDIFNPQVSVVARGLEGKIITIYGSNNLGKTKQATRFKKPFYLGFEKGLNAIAGVPFAPINNWSDFKKVNKQLTHKSTVSKAREVYQTIIFDEVEASARYCAKYICDKYDSDTIASGRDGFGLWKEYETAYWEEIDKLIGAGFTVVFIAHQTEDKEGKFWPKGDKRALAPVIDNSDIVVYLRSNGTDEKNQVIKSSAFLAETDKFFARSRFDYIQTGLREFTAEALEEAIIKAIEKQEEVEGIKAVTYEEQKETLKSQDLNFEELKTNIIAAGRFLHECGKGDTVTDIIENGLGKGKKVTDFTKNHVEMMVGVLDELNDAVREFKESQPE
ncbi:ATP-binding protein [Paenibacillus sp. EKM102P]|uniref:ATP-binding protein n=1 Tax=unclassified Paenibacillus TaxID=185978 RepID=UPI00142DA667|nr:MULTISPECIES: ATP-binding protein [unclassified Paenibacillus]KAF6620510.1 ATP-binding protein [Paenibacillus sp. EKM101P]KAF6623502.1 ATP-binding protein [Paenibacillus sp. EKM102P]KAF6633934.1 ATP-binding protein [Paenibacillus sp. EKM10P]KAF6649462.1 ATP-binding protein [Paenibacillus sp. EKM11P]